MGKNKLRRFAENEVFPHVFQPNQKELVESDHPMKGKWAEFFGNDHPITLELGCGGGEYTVGLAEHYPNRNFIGIDIKGARLWKGAKSSFEAKMSNIAFIRTRIHHIESFFTKDDNIDELWITFPDPQPREGKMKKRLTSGFFLNKYRTFAKDDCMVNLKTDSDFLMKFTRDEVVIPEGLAIHQYSPDIYSEFRNGPLVEIQTFYEKMWIADGLKIQYLQFELNKS